MIPYEEGQRSYMNGHPKSDCPYALLSNDREHWLSGWWTAKLDQQGVTE